jgi:hypothetical protein
MMRSARTIITGELQGGLVRRKKKADGSIFGIATIRDRDRLEIRHWKVFFGDISLIERVEKLRPGEPLSVAGCYYVTTEGDDVKYVASAFEVIDLHWPKKKSKKQIRAEEGTTSEEQAPADHGGPDDRGS